jgi:photosystem II oxygen-evolving enhancer protein 2
VVAALALPHLALGGEQGIGEGLDLFAWLAKQVQCQSLGRARTNARQSLELIDQSGQGAGEAAQGAAGSWGESRRGGRASGPECGLSACSAAAAGLNSYQSPDGRYAFLYPTGWTRVQVTDGPQVVFHDLINADETLSLVVSDVNSTNSLENLGSAVAVGEKLRRVVIAPEGSGREAELVEASEREDGGRTFYDLEYAVHLSDRDRHELATVVVDRGRLYTFAASTNEARWPRVEGLFHQVISSFTLRI